MKLRTRFLKWLASGNNGNADQHAEEEKYASAMKQAHAYNIGAISTSDRGSTKLTFNVIPASGGVVISINKYDQTKGQHTENLHVIHDDQDVANNIGHIVSMELLRSQ